MTRIEELQAELLAEYEKLNKPIRELHVAIDALFNLTRELRAITQRQIGQHGGELKTARALRDALYLMNEPTLARWNLAVRAFNASVVTDVLAGMPVECPRTNDHRAVPCVICGETLRVTLIGGQGGSDIVVEVTR